MNAEQIKNLQQEFGLSYHIEFAATAEQLVGFKGKRVLEVGGNLPQRLVFDVLGVIQWTALEEMDYWTETLSTGHVCGTPPLSTEQYKSLRDVTPSDISSYNQLYGGIEQLPQTLEAKYDLVFSVAAFEHITRLPLALEKRLFS